MSIRVLASAWRTACASHTQKLVLLNLADHANDCGVCWPSLDRIAKQCGLGKKTVLRQLERLEMQGMLAITRTEGGFRNPNRYRLILEELKALNCFEVFNPDKERGVTARHRLGVSPVAERGVIAWPERGVTARHSNRQEPSVEPPTPEAGNAPAQKRGTGSSSSRATFWESRARLELVERAILEIRNRASVCAMDTIIEPQDREKYSLLCRQRKELRTALNL